MTTPYSSIDMFGMRATRMAGLVLGLSLGIAGFMGAAQAEKVGVAAAVNPDAFSSLSGTPNKQLSIGKNIFYSERINTTASGLVQVLLLDGSTFTVGPNSDLVIDKFVYDPKKKTGEMIATFSKGTMRFIGGKLSKNDGGVTVKTPSGALAIRGGMFQGSTSRGIYSFLYGHSLTFSGRNGQSQTIFQPGYTLDLSGGRANVRPTTPEDTNVFMQALSSQSTQFGTAGGTTTTPGGPGALQDANNLQDGASEAISDANTIIVQTAIAKQLIKLNNLQNNTPPQNTPSTSDGTTGPTTPTVVKEGGTFTGYASGFIQTNTEGDGLASPRVVLGTSQVILDPKANTVAADFQVTNVDGLIRPTTTTYNLGFRGKGDGSYINDNDFLALADDGSSSVVRSDERDKYRNEYTEVITKYPDVTGSNLVSHSGGFSSLPPDPNAPTSLCTKCDFLKYGFFASNVTYGPHTDDMGGWWVATDRPLASNYLPGRGSATYEGLAVGTFVSKDENWVPRTATGDLSMTWNFSHRIGTLKVEDFAGKNFGGLMTAVGETGFGGGLLGSGLAIGAANGSFVGPNGSNYPSGVMGNFGVGNNSWKANGVFGAGLVTNQVAGQ